MITILDAAAYQAIFQSLVDSIVPLSVCVVLPVLVVLMVIRRSRHETDKRAEVMIKAIENGASVNSSFFNVNEKKKTPREKLLNKLLAGCVVLLLGVASATTSWFVFDDILRHVMIIGGACFVAVGVALLISYGVGKKILD